VPFFDCKVHFLGIGFCYVTTGGVPLSFFFFWLLRTFSFGALSYFFRSVLLSLL